MPVIAEDVDCNGCVDTADIADGAVTSNELASDVQAVLDQLNDRIDSLETRPSLPTAVDGNGNHIGQLLDAGFKNINGGGLYYYVTILTEVGYLEEVNGTLGIQSSRDVYFTGGNCTGDSYVTAGAIGPGWVIQASHKTTQSPNQGAPLRAFYVPLDAEIINYPAYGASRLREGICGSYNSPTEVYQVFPNEPAITGMQNELYTLPIRPVK